MRRKLFGKYLIAVMLVVCGSWQMNMIVKADTVIDSAQDNTEAINTDGATNIKPDEEATTEAQPKKRMDGIRKRHAITKMVKK